MCETRNSEISLKSYIQTHHLIEGLDRSLYLWSWRHRSWVDVVHIPFGRSAYWPLNTRNGTEFSEVKRLRRRIAELESVIRELKNNPHPRWTAPGGVVHNPNFFDSHRRSSMDDKASYFCPSAGDIIKDAVSADGAMVKSEETASYTQEFEVSKKGFLHGSSHAPPTYSPQPTASLSTNSEATATGSNLNPSITGYPPSYESHDDPYNTPNPYQNPTSTTMMDESATSIDTVAPCSPSTMFSTGDNLSLTCRRGHSNSISVLSAGVQSASTSVYLTNNALSSQKSPESCNCLKSPTAFGPLVHLGIALRTSREALEHLHPFSSNCVLYCRITVLEQHLLCVSCLHLKFSYWQLIIPHSSVPPEGEDLKTRLSPGPCMDSYSSQAHSTTLPHPPSKNTHENVLLHSLSSSRAGSTRDGTHQYPHPAPRSPDPFAYMLEMTTNASIHRQGWYMGPHPSLVSWTGQTRVHLHKKLHPTRFGTYILSDFFHRQVASI